MFPTNQNKLLPCQEFDWVCRYDLERSKTSPTDVTEHMYSALYSIFKLHSKYLSLKHTSLEATGLHDSQCNDSRAQVRLPARASVSVTTTIVHISVKVLFFPATASHQNSNLLRYSYITCYVLFRSTSIESESKCEWDWVSELQMSLLVELCSSRKKPLHIFLQTLLCFHSAHIVKFRSY